MKNLLQKSELNRKLRNFITLCFVCLLAIGNAWGQTIEINTTNSGVTGSYKDATFDVDNITFGFTQWMKSTTIQAKKSITNSLYNVDAIPGKITSITFVQTQDARAIKVYGGTSIKPTTEITAPTTAATMTFDFTGENYTYFSMTTPSNACYFSSITISYETQSSGTYTITYHANGATSGNVPTDANEYSDANNQVTVLGNTNNLAKDCHTFAGWNTAADGNGNSYTAGSTFTIENNTTLYAQWAQNTHALTLPQGNQYGTYTSSESDLSSVGCGENVTLIYTPVAGYEQYAATWSVNGNSISGDSFTMLDEDVAVTVAVEERNDVTFDFTQIDGFSDWTNSYSSHEIDYPEATVKFASANRQSSTITNQPVTKGQPVEIILKNNATMSSAKFVCTQWVAKEQTITMHYSTDGGSSYTSTGVTSDNFTITNNLLPEGTNAVKITFSSSDNQVGIASATIGLKASSTPIVATPTFTPAAGNYTEAQNVTISCETQGATIYYTTDGSTPTVASTPYSGPFDITSTTTVKAIAIKNGVSSDVATATYTIEPIVPGAWQLVTDASTLAVGDRVVIAAADYNYAMSTAQNDNNRVQVSVEKNTDNNTICNLSSDVQIFVLQSGTKQNTYAFYTGEGYLYAASSSKNYLRTQLDKNDNSSWTVAVTSEGIATIQAQGNFTHNIIKYNSANFLFSCYTGGQQPVALYKFIPDQQQVGDEWELVDIADLRVWDEIAIVDVNSGKAMSNNNGGSSAPTAVSVTLSADHSTITGVVGDNLKWTRSGDASGYWFFPKGSSSMLYVNDNGDLAIGAATATSKQFKAYSENGYTGLKHKTTSKFIGVDGYSWTASETISGNMANTSIAYYRHKLYSVYFMEGNGSCETASLMQSEFGGSITLPSAAPCSECSGYQFAGWATAPVNETDVDPTLYTGSYTPTADDQFLYAVYKNGTVYNSNPACAVINVTAGTPYVENFEGCTTSTAELTHAKPSCWTLVHQYNPMQANQRAQIATASAAAQSGTHSLNMRYSGIMAMPILADGVDIQDLQMDLYLKQPGAQYLLEVGVMSDLTDESTFEVVATLDNGSTQMEHRTVYFSSYVGNGSYIAFRNVFAPGTNGKLCYNYIDDITLSIATNACEITVTAEEPYTEDFEEAVVGVLPECWTLVHQDVTMNESMKPKVISSATNASSGDKCLYLSGRGIYAMPKLTEDIDVSTLQMEVSVKQHNATHQLVIGVMSDPNDPTTFHEVETINHGSSCAVITHVISFAGHADEGQYIAFRNTVTDGTLSQRSYNYIDDVTLSVRPNCDITLDEGYSEGFEEYAEGSALAQVSCWNLYMDVVMNEGMKPQIVNSPANAGSGVNVLYLSGRGIYSMPPLAEGIDVSTLQMEVSVKQHNASHQLVIGVMSNPNDPTTFHEVETINHGSSCAVMTHVISFAGHANEGQYIAFRNTVTEGTVSQRSYNYIDDITLSIASSEIRLAENEQAGEEVETMDETEETASYDSNDNFNLLTREPEVTVYPNPTTGNLHFAAMENVEKVEVYNNIGRLVATFNNQREINISDMPAGLYMLRVTLQGDAVVMKKVVKK